MPEIEQVDLEFGRYYKIKGRLYPSVTNILSIISKGKGFEKWLGNQTSYEAAELEKRRAAQRGSLVHDIIETELKGRKIEIEDNVRNYYRGFERFRAEHSLRIKKENIEFVVWSESLGYAGTVDLFGTLDGVKNCIIDIKTSKYIYLSAAIQVAAYANALSECKKIVPNAVLILQLNRESGYDLRIIDWQSHFENFIAAKRLWEADLKWRKEESEDKGS